MGGFKRNGAVLLILVAAVSGFGYIPSIPKICINQGYGGVAHFTSVGSSRGYDLFPPNGMNSMSLAGGGGGNWGRRGGRGGGGGDGGGGDDENARMEGDGCSDGISALALSGVMGSLWDEYNDMLNKNPVLTKACTSLAGFTIADVLAQKFVSQGNGTVFSCPRLARMATFGFLIHGTLSHYFYAKLDSLIPGSSAQNVVMKMLVDQVFWAPIFTAIFLAYTSTLEGKAPQQTVDKIRRDLWVGVRGSWTVWPIVHLINFRYISSKHRILYINSIQIAYNVFLSCLSNRGQPLPKAS